MKKAFALLLFVFSGAAAAQSPAVTPLSLYTIPGVANVDGRNGTRFVSDVAVTNPGTSEADVVLSFVPTGTLEDVEVTVPAGQTVVWRNVLQELWSLAGSAGAILATSDMPLLIRARTYNTASTGTFGAALPSVAEDRLLVAGERAHCLWVSQSPDGTRDFRTNISVAFPDADGGLATVTLFDHAGGFVGQWEFSASSADFQQISGSRISSSLPLGRAEIEVTSGRATAYASVVDNVTGDSSLFQFEPLPAGPQDVVVNGVARSEGRNATFFRTDARIFNPGPDAASLTVSFLASGFQNATPASATIPVPAGQILDVVDVLSTWFSAPAPSSGALRFQSDSPVAVRCRTSNVDPTGTKPGTFGAQQRPRPLLSFLSSAEAGTLLTGVRQDTSYRTNVGFASGPDGAAWSLTLKSADGVQIATASDTLGAFGWKQPNVQNVFPGAAIPGDAQIFIKVTSGSLDIFDSSVDQASGDSVASPFERIPGEIPSSAAIGPEGGSVRSDDGKMTIRIPAGALASAGNVALLSGSGTVPNALGPGYSLSVDGPALTKAPLAVYQYGQGELDGSAPEWLGLAMTTGSDAYALAGASIDTAERTVSTPIPLTPPGGLVKSAAARTPLTIFRMEVHPFASLLITPTTAVALSGQTVHFQVTGTQTDPSNKKIYPATFDGNLCEWVLVGAAGDDYVMNYGASADYIAPTTLKCIQRVSLDFQYPNPGQSHPIERTVRITLLPRSWRLGAQSEVEVNLCAFHTNAVTFSLTTDIVRTTLTLREDLTFEPATASVPESFGVLKTSSFCHDEDCTLSWATEPDPAMQFVMEQGGWAKGQLYFSYWGFALNGDGLHPFKVRMSCKGIEPFVASQLQPNIALYPENPPLLFNLTVASCNARKTFSFQEFQRWIGVSGKTPFDRTIYTLILIPFD